MIKRLIPALCALTILLSCVVPCFGAESEEAPPPLREVILDYNDYVVGRNYIPGGYVANVSFPAVLSSVYVNTSSGPSSVVNDVTGSATFRYTDDCFASFKLCFPGNRYSEPRYYMSLDNIPDGTPLRLFSRFFVDPVFSGTYDLLIFYQINYYDATYKNIAVLPTKAQKLTYSDCSGRFDGVFTTDDIPENLFDIPDGSKYVGLSLVVRVENLNADPAAELPDQVNFNFGFSDYTLGVTQYYEPFDVGSCFDIFGSVGEWTVDSVGSFSSVFWNAETGTLTFIGILGVAGLAIAVIVLLVFVISKYLRFR